MKTESEMWEAAQQIAKNSNPTIGGINSSSPSKQTTISEKELKDFQDAFKKVYVAFHSNNSEMRKAAEEIIKNFNATNGSANSLIPSKDLDDIQVTIQKAHETLNAVKSTNII